MTPGSRALRTSSSSTAVAVILSARRLPHLHVELGAEQHRAIVVARRPLRAASPRSCSTRPSKATLAVGLDPDRLLKSNASGDSSSVNSATPLVVAFTVLPVRTRSTRPTDRVLSNIDLAAVGRSGSGPRAARRRGPRARACR